MKNKVIKFCIGLVAVTTVAGTTVAAGTNTKGLSVGGAKLIEGGIECNESNTSVNNVTTEPTTKNTIELFAGASPAKGISIVISETAPTNVVQASDNTPVSNAGSDVSVPEQAVDAGEAVMAETQEITDISGAPETENANLTLGDLIVMTGENLVNAAIEEEQRKAEAANQTKIERLESELTAEIEAEAAAEAAAEAEAAANEAVVSAGATIGMDITLPEEGEEEDDEDVDTLYGYTNLGIAIVDDHLNVRETADETSRIVGKMSNDSGCEILEIVDGKAHIVSGSVEGYVSTDYILTGDLAAAYASQIVKKLATVSADGLKVRTAPDLESAVVNMVAYGEELEVVEELDGWVKVLYDGQEVYVNSEYVTVGENLKTALNMSEFLYGSGVSDVRVALCEYAKQFIGNRYVWGGTSLTKGADCSGYVLSIFGKYGYSLPHSSRAQANMGRKVSVAEARPGDLVFYSKGGRINHVAIYIGGGQVVHASSPKYGIRITSVYYRTPTTVRRIIQD